MIHLLGSVLVIRVGMALIVQVRIYNFFLTYLTISISMKFLNVYYHEQSLIVLVMVCVQIKGLVMIRLDPAYAMKDLRGTLVKVKIMSNCIILIKSPICLLH